jgi:two-component system LytT family response regulator
MNRIRAVIVDDEPLARRGVRQMLSAHRDFFVVGEARNGREAVQAISKLKPDLVFLDVQMPALDGFGVLQAVGPKKMPEVIFVTAYDEYAVRAFDAHALDYLVKPLEVVRFAEAVERVRQRLESSRAFELSRKLSALLASRERAKPRIVVPVAKGQLVIDLDEIDWIEADDYYAAIHARGGRHLIRESLTSLAKRLDPSRFLRVHRSAIVNMNRVREVVCKDGRTFIVLLDGVRVRVSRRRRSTTRKIVRHLENASEAAR